MLERLEVHGKVYEPVSVVAESVSYSEEELIELIKAKHVPGALIDSEWFVDRVAAVREQKIRPSNANKRTHAARKVTRAEAIKTVYAERQSQAPAASHIVSLQAVAVIGCGLLVGSLMYWTDQAQLDTLMLEAGVIEAGASFVEGMQPVWEVWSEVFRFTGYE